MARALYGGMATASSAYMVRRLLPATAKRLRERVLHAMVRGLVHVAYRFKKTNIEAVPEGPAVLVCNHISFVDALLLGAAFHRPVRFVMDHKIYRNPLMRWFFDAIGVIPIASKKHDPQLLDVAFQRCRSALRRGELVCIFPEGMITHDGEMNEFRGGVQRMVDETPVPVVPMALRGMWGSFFSRKGGRAMARWPRRFWSKVELRAGTAVPPANVTPARLQADVQALLDAA